jgi:hypothetical protein
MINIPGYLLGAIIFLVGQTSAAIWWASGISSDVEMLKQDRDEMAEIIEHKQDRDEMSEIIEHLDVLAYRMEHLEQLIQRAFGPEIK